MHHPQKRGTRNTAGEATDYARLEVNNEGIAEALRHEGDPLVIGREVGPLTEVRQHFHVFRQVIERVPVFALGGENESGYEYGEEQSHL
jgi:hypothetical protein